MKKIQKIVTICMVFILSIASVTTALAENSVNDFDKTFHENQEVFTQIVEDGL